MFAIEDFLRVSNQMRDYYAKKIKDSFQEFNFSPNEISILIVLKNNSPVLFMNGCNKSILFLKLEEAQ